MKRSVALVLTIIIFAAIAVCFLRPTYPDWYFKVDGGKVTIVARPLGGRIEAVDVRDIGEPVPIELEGDSDLIQIAIERFDVINGYGAIRYKAKAAVGQGLINGAEIWRDSKRFRLPSGYAERIDGNAAGARMDIPEGGIRWSYQNGEYGVPISTDEPQSCAVCLPFDDPGLYRVTLCLYDWDSERGRILSDKPHEVSFCVEYIMPSDNLSVYNAVIKQDSRMKTNGEIDCREVSLLFYNDSGNSLYVTDRTMEKKTDSGWTDCSDKVITAVKVAENGKNECFRIWIKRELELGDYRLAVSFGDGRVIRETRYTFTVYFQIDE